MESSQTFSEVKVLQNSGIIQWRSDQNTDPQKKPVTKREPSILGNRTEVTSIKIAPLEKSSQGREKEPYHHLPETFWFKETIWMSCLEFRLQNILVGWKGLKVHMRSRNHTRITSPKRLTNTKRDDRNFCGRYRRCQRSTGSRRPWQKAWIANPCL